VQTRPLTDLPAALIAAGYRAPSYRTAYEAARSARIPVIRLPNGRWAYCPDDLPAIAAALLIAA